MSFVPGSAPDNHPIQYRRPVARPGNLVAATGRRNPERDWILTRILWLSASEIGTNRWASATPCSATLHHGTPDTEPMGIPHSHGCIRMRNADMLDLFDGWRSARRC